MHGQINQFVLLGKQYWTVDYTNILNDIEPLSHTPQSDYNEVIQEGCLGDLHAPYMCCADGSD